jgi:hypothetical protein
MTGPTSHEVGSETKLTVSEKTSGASHRLRLLNSYLLTNLDDGAEIHEENDEREDGSSEAPTQTTETQVVLDSEAQAHAHARRVGREAHFDRCLYSPRNCVGLSRSDVSRLIR